MAENKKEKGFSMKNVLAGLPDVSKSDTEGREQIEYIDIGLIDDDPNNFYSLDGVDDLAANIELVGLQQPLRLRRSPKVEGRYIIISGHRRRAALNLLAKQDPDKWGVVACIVERWSVMRSDAMVELKLIYANSNTRTMTDADKARQAERVTALLYQLKEEGVEFPGRMRDYVAEACQISKTKLARLKVIQDKLVAPKFVEMWQAGELKEDPAYVLAQMPALMQEAIAKYKGKLPSADVLRKIQERGMGHYLSTPVTCESGEGCTNGEKFLFHDLAASHFWDIGDCRCCVDCDCVQSCRYACKAGKEAAKKQKEKAAKSAEKSQAAAAAATKRKVDFATEIAQRVLAACGGQYEAFYAVSKELNLLYWGIGHAVKAVAEGRKVPDDAAYNRISMEDLAAFCRQLSVSADYLLGLADKKEVAGHG